jgi:high-affinity Fe2+/Pb2+ permease
MEFIIGCIIIGVIVGLIIYSMNNDENNHNWDD